MELAEIIVGALSINAMTKENLTIDMVDDDLHLFSHILGMKQSIGVIPIDAIYNVYRDDSMPETFAEAEKKGMFNRDALLAIARAYCPPPRPRKTLKRPKHMQQKQPEPKKGPAFTVIQGSKEGA